MTKPDYIVIGAMKCGTSTLAAQLGAQDGVFMTTPKEPNYFSDDDVFAKGSDWYAALFDAAAPNDLKGEASTHYTKAPDYPNTLPRMTGALEQVKLVYMIRNPIVRLVSHYIHGWSMGDITGSLEEALQNTPALRQYGEYGMQIAPFLKAYGPQSVLLTSLERLKAQPDAELARIGNHIGHSGAMTWVDDMAQQNVSADRMRRLPLQGLLIDNPVARALRRSLVPKSLRNRVRNTRLMQERPEIPADLLPALHAHFMQDRQLLSQHFPNDPSLEMCYPFGTNQT